MIIEQNKAFLLNGNNFTYAIRVNALGDLQTVYYGEKLSATDLDFMQKSVADPCIPALNELNRETYTDGLSNEFGSFGRGDYREPTALVVRKDGAQMSSFRYVSHKIFKGVPEVKGLPHARSGGDTLSVTLKDEFSDVEVTLNYTVWDELGVIVRNAEYKNTGKDPVSLKKAFSFAVTLPERDYGVLRLYGNWAKERSPQVTPLGYGTVRVQSLRGSSSHCMNPFMGLLAENCSEDAGECYGVQLVYSGSFALTAEKNPANGTVRLQGGVNDTGFEWYLEGGETFVAPQAALCYSSEGLGGMSRAYADFLRERVINPDRVFARRPIVINNWEATYFDFGYEKLCEIIDAASELGVDTFVLDDGWFGKRDSDTSGLGDWVVNEKKLKGGLNAVIARCKEKGLKFGLWFEPEMVSEDSDLYRAHPDWAMHKAGTVPVRMRNQLILDFSRKEVVDSVFGAVSKVLSSHEISYVKWDMNRTMTEFFSAALPAVRMGEIAHRYILGVYDLAERLTAAFPKVFFEGCAGGGARFDAGMLYYFAQFWTSDDTDAYERTKIQWGTSVCYPVSAMSCHVSACPNHQTRRTTPFATRGAIASLGATGYELDPSKLTEEEKKETKAQIEAYKRISELVLKGDLYRLSSPFTENYFCEMLVSKDKTTAYLVGERFHGDPNDYMRILRLNGLDDRKTYRIEELGFTASGKALRTVGVPFPRLSDFGGWTWHLTEVK